jgi:hypothetical protein
MTPTTIDWTPIVGAIVGGVFSIVGSVFLAWLQSHMKDQAAAATLGKAVQNALGAAQNAVDAGLKAHPLQSSLPVGTSPAVASGVQYVLNQAGPEMARLGVTPDAVAGKVEAQIGLSRIAAPIVTPLMSGGVGVAVSMNAGGGIDLPTRAVVAPSGPMGKV